MKTTKIYKGFVMEPFSVDDLTKDERNRIANKLCIVQQDDTSYLLKSVATVAKNILKSWQQITALILISAVFYCKKIGASAPIS